LLNSPVVVISPDTGAVSLPRVAIAKLLDAEIVNLPAAGVDFSTIIQVFYLPKVAIATLPDAEVDFTTNIQVF
jgi:hypothetical protein